MLLRMLVSQLLRRAAEQKIFEQVAKAAYEPRDQTRSTGDADDDPATPQPPSSPCEVAFVFALGIESGGFVDLLQNPSSTKGASFLEYAGQLHGHRVVVADAGVGRERAEKATDDLIALHQPSWVVSAGFAGALREELRRGHILMPQHLVDGDGNQLSVGFRMDSQDVTATKGLHVGRLLTVDRIIRTTDEKRKLSEQYDAVACDMESMAVAEVCRRHEVRFLCVRVISDALDDQLPQAVEKLLGQKSIAGKLGAAAGAILQRPSVLKDMWQLKEDALKASDRLAKFLTGVVLQLTGDV